jgi:hypothetical protein
MTASYGKGNLAYLVTSSGSGSYTAPTGYTKVDVEAIGGGGNGIGATTSNRAGGGGAGYGKTTGLSVTGGTTVVYYSVGAANNDSWVRVGTNSAPSSTTDGCLGYRGGNASSGTAGTGATTANCIGTTTQSGANGTRTSSGVGGGAGGDGGNASGQTGGGSGDMKGGNGGAYQNAGTAPGGGGGADTATNGNKAGAVGRVRITFKP